MHVWTLSPEPVETEVAVDYDTVDGEKASPLCKIPADPGCNEIQVYTLEGQESIGNIRYFKERYLEETPVFDAKLPSDEEDDSVYAGERVCSSPGVRFR